MAESLWKTVSERKRPKEISAAIFADEISFKAGGAEVQKRNWNRKGLPERQWLMQRVVMKGEDQSMKRSYRKTAVCLCMLLWGLTACAPWNSAGQNAGNSDTADGSGGLGQNAGSGSDSNAGNGSDNNSGGSGSSSKESALSWQADYARLENCYNLALAADRIYGCYSGNGQVLLDSMNRENLSVSGTAALPDTSAISGLTEDGEGNVYLLESKEDDVSLWKIASDGSLQDEIEIDLEGVESENDLRLKGIDTDAEGHFYVWCEVLVPEIEVINNRESEVWHFEDRVYVKDQQFRTIFYQAIWDMSGTQVLNFQVDTTGKPVFIVREQEEIYIQEIDMDRESLGEQIRLDEKGEIFTADTVYHLEHLVPTEDGFLYCLNNELYEFHFDTQIAEKLFNLSTYGLFSSDILFLAKRGDVVEVIDNHGDSESSELVSFTFGESDKRILTLGMVMTVQGLEKAVAEFNRYSREYQVEILDYYRQAGNYEDAMEQLNLDVITGKAPDIISMSGIDSSLFSKKGLFSDLYDFMQDDPECSKDMLMPSVCGAYEENGHLYSISPSFLLHSMWGYRDVTGGRSGVTFEELFQILEDSGKDLNAIGGFSADEPVLTRLCTVSMDEFVDWENGICAFDGEYFKRALSFAKEYTGNYTGGTWQEQIRNREVVMTVGLISGVSDYQIQNELFGGDAAFIGYPVAEGRGTAIAFLDSDVAVNARKEDPAGAWEFVKFYLLQGYDGQGFPVLKEQFEQAMAAAMTEDYGMAEDGRTERIPKDSYHTGKEYIFIYAATQDDVDAVKALVESAEKKCEIYLTIQNIINEEAEGYFSGQVDLDRTADKIQNRVSLLLQESLN